MKNPALACEKCGSTSLRRSHSRAVSDVLKMARGVYPFRCLACNARFWANVWRLSRLRYASCPQCLNQELTGWPDRYRPSGIRRPLLLRLGAHAYRCPSCHCKFVSFRPRYRDRNARAEREAAPAGGAE